MQRYHSYPGTGDGTAVTLKMVRQGIGSGYDESLRVMRPDDAGFWVRYDEATLKIDDLSRNLAGLLLLTKDFVDGLKSDVADGSISQGLYSSYDQLIGAYEQANKDHGDQE
jgi:hypothetical protein